MRIVTRADFDGLVCASIITLMEEIDSFFFVEPKFMQDGLVDIRSGDIIANLPYHPNCRLWFDHHITNKAPGFTENSLIPGRGGFRLAPSAARVVYEYYTKVIRGASPESKIQNLKSKMVEGLKILESDRFKDLLEETDKVDAALLKPEEVLHPQGYVLISMTIDGVRPQDEPYWLRLIELLRDAPVEAILKEPEVKRRCQEILDSQERLKEILLQRTTLKSNVIFTDLRGIRNIPDGNRFLIYTLFPKGNISLKIANDSQRPNTTAISVGYNIFNGTSEVNVGELLRKFGGGGHRVVGSCRVPDGEAEKAIAQIFEAIKE